MSPAFILGNSPSLPVDDLECLDGCLTIGVNRILLSGFTPTVVLWIDGTVYKNDAANRVLMDETDALLVCDRSVKQTEAHHGLVTHVGDSAYANTPKPSELVCNGNTGVCAALWALSMGYGPVYLVGMDAAYAGGKTDFYGVNKWHKTDEGDRNTTVTMRREVDDLMANHGDNVLAVPSGPWLWRLSKDCEKREQASLRRDVLARMSIKR